ncbi:FecR family protein [Mucilaginibacter calamicampi]|uniref:FecR family protein n=1 Tax=Mucilaginibacter calamicampi TaxID=1302352 RepID=A0ABW2YT10_9SPHI
MIKTKGKAQVKVHAYIDRFISVLKFFMKKDLSVALLEKYFKDECNEIEIAEINSWYDSFDSSSDDISQLSEQEQQLFKQLMLGNILENIGYGEKGKERSLDQVKPSRARVVLFATSIAAAVLLCFFLINNGAQRSLNVAASKQQHANNNVVANNITNAIQKIVLSDGSRVWLSPNSKLTYPKSFAVHNRQVSMTGEAFFEVTKDKKRPFSIFSENTVTKVWGTSFRIRAYKNELTKVSVVTGRVSVSVAVQPKSTSDVKQVAVTAVRQELMLTPDQEAIYDRKLNFLKKNVEITDPSISIWKNTSISFENTPMPEVFRILSKKFKVNISSTDSKINSDYLNADFTNESLPSIMEIINKSLNVSYTVKGNQFILQSN